MPSDSNSFKLPQLSSWHKTKLLRWAKQLLTAQQQLLSINHNNLLQHTLEHQNRHQSIIHYPKGDRIDHRTGGQYFYHCHRENYDTYEHGHFHCFLRQSAIPKHRKRSPTLPYCKQNSMTHLIAIGMNQLGQPIRLFTVNRWVTDETWYDAEHLPYLLRRFKMSLQADSSWSLLDQWVEAMIHLFAPQIHWLHQQRDLRMLHHQQLGGDCCHEQRSIEELSSLNIDLTSHIQWLIDSKPQTS